MSYNSSTTTTTIPPLKGRKVSSIPLTFCGDQKKKIHLTRRNLMHQISLVEKSWWKLVEASHGNDVFITSKNYVTTLVHQSRWRWTKWNKASILMTMVVVMMISTCQWIRLSKLFFQSLHIRLTIGADLDLTHTSTVLQCVCAFFFFWTVGLSLHDRCH